ncbi:HAMP domain-containing sensor histidine kinase [Thalassobaculum sp. OXR-137]|uniref:sensor histidine kinase n=1 Tax=Thalassobaculum sp. OXR-137 TaxID=3100173 RepID=UPI002AC89659|nr:HAMP domain-containing sensor histidine kinase [Thalassobaculum sp. OXR-137]WPZ34788.1 HAMP domain-containing sensor histidine kinase [Thalassobaculum sp. OXR-137]
MRSLSFRLLCLTIFFVMVSEVLIYTPSIARFRLTYLTEKLDKAHLAALTIDGSPDRVISQELTFELLDHVGAYEIVVTGAEGSRKSLSRPMFPTGEVEVSLYDPMPVELVVDAFDALFQTGNRILRVTGPAPMDPASTVSITIDEFPLREVMYDFSWRILTLSVLISVFTAALVFVSLRWLLVRPLQRITESLVAFRKRPEDRSTDLDDRGRRDEIGVALRELGLMKEEMRAALRQRTRLAALGTAVSKISHDLRNMLSTATLISDRLAMSQDPDVQKVTPTLVKAIDRAVALCSTTLNFTRETPPLKLAPLRLADLIADLRADLAPVQGREIQVHLDQTGDVVIQADRDQMYRALSNIASNAVNAGADTLRVTVREEGGRLLVDLADNGPGIPEEGRGRLFQPFQFSTRRDGTGLGLTIARDLVQAHGGSLTLERTGSDGSTFRMNLPVQSAG